MQFTSSVRRHDVESRMRALVQRVSQAAVDVEGKRVVQIGPGLLVLLGVRRGDTAERAERRRQGTDVARLR
jgi:D-Tyr-tRNAtyr deacylase